MWASVMFLAMSMSTRDHGAIFATLTAYSTNTEMAPKFISNVYVAMAMERAASGYSKHLTMLVSSNKWKQAFDDTRWMTQLPHSSADVAPDCLGLWSAITRTINTAFPSWRAWAAWQPSLPCLTLRASLAAKEGMAHAKQYCILEGPDMTGHLQPTLEVGMAARMQVPEIVNGVTHLTLDGTSFAGEFKSVSGFCIKFKTSCDNQWDFLRRFGGALDSAAAGSQWHQALFKMLCLDKIPEDTDLAILEALGPHYPQEAIESLLKFYTFSSKPGLPEVRIIRGFMQCWGSAWFDERLRCAIGPTLSSRVLSCMTTLKGALKLFPYTSGDQNDEDQSSIEQSTLPLSGWQPSENLLLELQSFGAVIKDYTWLLASFDYPTQALLARWPSVCLIQRLIVMRGFLLRGTNQGESSSSRRVLLKQVDEFVRSQFIVQPQEARACGRLLVERLLKLWPSLKSDKHKLLALSLAEGLFNPFDPRWQCLDSISTLEEGAVQRLCDLSEGTIQEAVEATYVLLHAKTYCKTIASKHWALVITRSLNTRGPAMARHGLDNRSARDFVTWLGAIANLMNLWPLQSAQASEEGEHAQELSYSLQIWLPSMRKYVAVLESFDTATQHSSARSSTVRILLGSYCRRELAEQLFPVLQRMKDEKFEPCLALMQSMLARLDAVGDNAVQISTSVARLSAASTTGLQICKRLLAHDGDPQMVAAAKVLRTWWFSQGNLSQPDRDAFCAVWSVLELPLDADLSKQDLDSASSSIEQRIAELLDQAAQLEGLRQALKLKDAPGTQALLASIGIEDSKPFDDMLAALPGEIADFVERDADNVLELQYPLTDDEVKALQRIAMGVGRSKMLLVRLLFDVEDSTPIAFCLHLSNESPSKAATDRNDDRISSLAVSNSKIDAKVVALRESEYASEYAFNNGHAKDTTSQMAKSDSTNKKRDAKCRHDPWYARIAPSLLPEVQTCYGEENRTTYQLRRALHRHMQQPFTSLESTYTYISTLLKDLTSSCIVCGVTPVNPARLHRSTTCNTDCGLILRRSSLNIRLADIIHDDPVADLLLTSIHAAAVKNNPLLLPSSPISAKSDILTALAGVSKLSTIDKTADLVDITRDWPSRSESILNYALTHYRGFLASATTQQLRIPSMPGAAQFLLANTTPELERDFAARLASSGLTEPKVLFHGTSMDRLYAILTQGLRVQSNTNLMTHAAVYGAGIYAAESPGTALGYATNYFCTSSASSGWRYSAFSNRRVLLSLAYAGTAPGRSDGIHVVQDPKMLVVRYVFLVPLGFQAPIAGHVVPAILSVFSSLRRGAV